MNHASENYTFTLLGELFLDNRDFEGEEKMNYLELIRITWLPKKRN